MTQREIKFRAWDREKKKFEYFELASHATLTTVKIPSSGTWDSLNGWMQFTGLHDKHGNRIFEGDLCKHPSGIFKVEYKFGGFCLIYPKWANEKTFFDWLHFQSNEIEIIGNVFDNPELIE